MSHVSIGFFLSLAIQLLLTANLFLQKKLQVWADEQTYTNDIVQVETDKHSITVNKKLHLKSVFSTNRLPQLQK